MGRENKYGRHAKPTLCGLCKRSITGWAELREHLVAEHGFVKEPNGMVYHPKKCHCGKVAIYKVNKTGYCRDHKQEAVARMQNRANVFFEPRHRMFQEIGRSVDRGLKNLTPRNFGVENRLGTTKENHQKVRKFA